jgi:hypothetical protein
LTEHEKRREERRGGTGKEMKMKKEKGRRSKRNM